MLFLFWKISEYFLLLKGDLERTIPNIGSILNVEADILQLDVIRLFTSMEDEVWE